MQARSNFQSGLPLNRHSFLSFSIVFGSRNVATLRPCLSCQRFTRRLESGQLRFWLCIRFRGFSPRASPCPFVIWHSFHRFEHLPGNSAPARDSVAFQQIESGFQLSACLHAVVAQWINAAMLSSREPVHFSTVSNKTTQVVFSVSA